MMSDTEPMVPLELAQRLAGLNSVWEDAEPPRARVIGGALPSNLPIDLPLPPGARVLGSRLAKSPPRSHLAGRGIPQIEDWADIYLDVPADAATIFAFYETAMPERGWYRPPPMPPSRRSGFAHTPFPPSAPQRRYCAGPHGPWLSVKVYERRDEPSDVRIHANLSGTSICLPDSPVPPTLPLILTVLPELGLPPSTRVWGNQGGSGNDDEWVQNALAETTLSAADLERHYAQQLIDAGWVQRESGTNGPLAWSIWSSPPPGTWDAALWVVEEPEPGFRYLHLRVLRAALRQQIAGLIPRG